MLYFEMLRLDAGVLLRETTELTTQERWVTARLLVRLAAVEKRELYAPCGYSSMWEYCLGELQMSEESAGRRLWAARKCRDFPALFDALADGRINMTAVHTLATHLKGDNVEELVAAATGRTKAQLLDWLACRFPRPAAPTLIQPVVAPAGRAGPAAAEASTMLQPLAAPAALSGPQPLAAPAAGAHAIAADASAVAGAEAWQLWLSARLQDEPDSHSLASASEPSNVPNPATPQVPLRARAHVDPLNAEQVRVQFTMSRRVLAKMQAAMDLLGEAVPRNDIAALFERLLDIALPTLEKRKFAATDRPRTPRKSESPNARTVPARVKNEVWKRDGGRCTFASSAGRRCERRRALEFDHVKPVAMGGEATVENIRLLCRKHNQLEAELRLGANLMNARRAAAKRRRASGSAQRPADAGAVHAAAGVAQLLPSPLQAAPDVSAARAG